MVILYMIFVVLGVAIFAFVFVSTRRGRAEGGQGAPVEKLERFEPIWGLFVVLLLGVLLAFTIWRAPWFQDQDGDQQVSIEGIQFGFLVQPTSVTTGTPVTFTVRSRDVNHSVGLYDPDEKLILNIEALPGNFQKRTYTFTKPGTYAIRCLEFCGYQHHKMVYPTFQVTES
ncbi:MAG: hypothetical protein MUE51_00605 [Thermoleophilia bacterium]|jgi:heme/copper-type cytochrome/quinol oxidase subunit 2|nr:hypothetical protein [Thermoleophilia bacterium]